MANRVFHVVFLAALVAGCSEDEPLGFETGPLGAVEVDAGAAVQVRSMLPLALTGLQNISESIQKAIELAIEDYGPIHGRAVALDQPVDTMCSSDGGGEGARQIAADPQVVGVIGPTCSEASVGASPVLSAAGLAMISPANASPDLTSDLAGNPGPAYHPGYFRVYSNGLYQAQAVAHFAYDELGLRRMATIHDGDSVTQGLATAFANAFSALGGEVVAIATVSKGDTDMSAVLADFAAAEPDGIFLPLFASEGYHLVSQAKEFDGLGEVTLIAGSSTSTQEFLGQPESEGVYLSGHDSHFGSNTNQVTGKDVNALSAEYQAATDANFFFHAYDATTLLLSAIESVAVEESGKLYIDRVALREEIAATTDFQGIIGTLTCDEFGDCGTGHVNIYYHADSSITDVAQLPVEYQFAP
ncbi:MAG: branched-chain amino acid ABC transporter substrate-binding protein [Gemmatimonadetes bacterium]|nr:branched-chain amino acid ABC transporter substrate-binding protein [Gemmatimonadota bacterium]